MSLTDLLKSFWNNKRSEVDSLKLGLERRISFSSKEEFYRELIHPIESAEVKNFYLSSINSPLGRALEFLLDKKGYKRRMPDYYIYLDMPNSILAATIKISDGTNIIAYNQRHTDLLRNNSLQRLYVNLHEHAHVRGIMSETQTDAAVENAALDFSSALQHNFDYTKKLLPSFTTLKDRLVEYIDVMKIAWHARYRQESQYA